MRSHVFTGATGFVGSAIVLELLSRSDDCVLGVVRPGQSDPTARLRGVLHELVQGYALPEHLHAAIESRVSAVAGDLWEERCGVDSIDGLEDPEFWHCAASLQYQDRYRKQIERTNIDGTAHAIELARSIGASRFNAISTAYVAGSRTGHIAAEPACASHANNCYESSKVAAEALTRASGLHVRILRPGIVIGHSQTHFALNYNGFYGFIRGLMKFRRAMERAQPGLAERLELKMSVEADGAVGLVPVDHVARDAVGLSLRDAQPDIYHLTNDTPPRIGEVIEVTFELAGLKRPTFIEDREGLGTLDRKLDDRVDFYRSYIVNSKHFDRSTTDSILGDDAAACFELDRQDIVSFGAWYSSRLAAERKELPVQR